MARTTPVAAGSGDRPTVTSGLMVAAMTWVVVPVMTWLFRGWLARSPSAPTTRGWASCEGAGAAGVLGHAGAVQGVLVVGVGGGVLGGHTGAAGATASSVAEAGAP
jgi:uncharacterized membrane protein